MNNIYEPEVSVGAKSRDWDSEGVWPEATWKEANSVQDWASLNGKYVKVYRGGRLIREGLVEAVSPDSQIIWLQSFGANLRVLFERAEGYEVLIPP